MWSSWPWVITNPLNFSWFFKIYVISGITKSTPNISSSGKDSPQSTAIISSPYSKTVMFFPISCNPPSGIILNFGLLNPNCSSFSILLVFEIFSLLVLGFLSTTFSFFVFLFFKETSAFTILFVLLFLIPLSAFAVFSLFSSIIKNPLLLIILD